MRLTDETRKYFAALGKKGGKNRAKKLSPQERREIARKGAKVKHENEKKKR